MVRYRLAFIAFAGLALAMASSRLYAKEHSRFDRLANKLDLTEQQRGQLKQIYDNYAKKMLPVREQLWTLHHEKWEAVKQVLTADQRAKMPEAVKTIWEKEWQAIAGKLNLSAEQKQSIAKIHNEYAAKFMKEMQAQGNKKPRSFREIRNDFFQAVCQQLNDKQKAELPAVLRDEFHEWRSAEFRQQQIKSVADQLSLSAEQRKKIQDLDSQFQHKTEKPLAQLKQLRQEEFSAMKKVLTETQRAKLQKMREKFGCGSENTTEKKSQ